MAECIFCQIVVRKIPAQIQFEDEQVLVFTDIAPKAPVHWLIIPKEHIPSVQELTSDQVGLAGHLLTILPRLAAQAGVAQSGYRVLTSIGKDGGQEVPHLHLHLLGGRALGKID